MLKISITGKLYLAGEYNVIRPKGKGVLIPSNKTLDFLISKTSDFSIVSTKKKSHFTYNDNFEVFGLDDNQIYTKRALEVVLKYLDQEKITISPFKIKIVNNLEDESKYGLGSSSAIFVGVIKAVLLFHNVNLSNKKIFKLAVVSQKLSGALSSGGDLALCITGVTTYYESYDVSILDKLNGNLNDIINQPWEGLMIKALNNVGLNVYVGYSGVSYKTENNYLADVLKHDYYHKFSSEADLIVSQLKSAFIDKNQDLILELISKYYEVLSNLSSKLEVPFITTHLHNIINKTRKFVFSTKISGAGFGDSIIAITKGRNEVIKKVWHQENIKLIDIIKI